MTQILCTASTFTHQLLFYRSQQKFSFVSTVFLLSLESTRRVAETIYFVSLQMSNITVTYRDGRVAQLEQVYIRGSKIRFLILPDMLKNAPMLKSMKNKNQGSGAGRGKAAILKAQGERGGLLDQDLAGQFKPFLLT